MRTRVVAPRVVRVCLATLLLLMAFTTPAARAEDVSATCEGTCTLYLPVLERTADPPPLLNPSTDTIESVAPVLSWTVVTTGTYRIQLSTKSDLSNPLVNATTTLGTATSVGSLVITFNLSNSTRYYWRVSVRPEGKPTYIPSALGSFVTGSKSNLPVPPAPTLLAPQPKGSVSVATATATWGPVAGATYYRIKVVDGLDFENGSTAFSQVVDGSTTTLAIAGLKAGRTYTWSVRALNPYAWSNYAPERAFTTTP